MVENGGGNSQVGINKLLKKEDLHIYAKDLLFPNGNPTKGSVEQFDFNLHDFKEDEIDNNLTFGDTYESSKMLHFYLFCKLKDEPN